MKIRAPKNDLTGALARAAKVTSTVTTLPVLQGVKCSTQNGQLHLVGSDTETTIRTSVAADILQPGTCLIPGRVLNDAIKRLPDGPITVHHTGEYVEVSGGGPAYTLRVLDIKNYPNLPDPDTGESVTLDGDTLATALNQVLVAASKEAADGVLGGVRFENYKNGIRLAATDRYRLAVADIPGPSLPNPATIPARALKEVTRHIISTQTQVTIQESTATFGSEHGTLTVRLLEGQYPNYQALLPEGYPTRVTIDKPRLLEAFGRSSVMADEHIPVQFGTHTDHVELNVQRTDLGTHNETVPAETVGVDNEGTVTGFNHRYIQEGIAATNGTTVTIELSDPIRPAVITTSEDNNFRYILMPIRI